MAAWRCQAEHELQGIPRGSTVGSMDVRLSSRAPWHRGVRGCALVIARFLASWGPWVRAYHRTLLRIVGSMGARLSSRARKSPPPAFCICSVAHAQRPSVTWSSCPPQVVTELNSTTPLRSGAGERKSPPIGPAASVVVAFQRCALSMPAKVIRAAVPVIVTHIGAVTTGAIS